MGRENIFPCLSPSPLLQSTCLLYPVSLSLLQSTCLLKPRLSLSLSSSPLVSSTPSPTRLPLYRLPYDHISFMSSLLSVTYLGQRLFVYVSAPFLSIHSSVPHLPDSDTILFLHSAVPYHMWKLGLFHWHLPFVTYSVRSCAVPVYT